MKQQLKSTIIKSSKSLITSLITDFAMLCVLALPAIGYSQAPPPPGPGGGATNPDAPLGGVPFDDNMTLAFLAVAIVFAVIILKGYQKRLGLPRL